jgi:hypothetical protein
MLEATQVEREGEGRRSSDSFHPLHLCSRGAERVDPSDPFQAKAQPVMRHNLAFEVAHFGGCGRRICSET